MKVVYGVAIKIIVYLKVSVKFMSHLGETEEKKNREYLFALASVEGIGSVRIRRLLERFGNAERVFDADLADIAQLPQFNPMLASRILIVQKRFSELQHKLNELSDQGIKVLFPHDVEYPTLLKSTQDAPMVLCKAGGLTEVSEKCVAIVGSQHPKADGINVALELSMRLVEVGWTIVSGLAVGIDTTAHYGALGLDGITIGVLSTDLSTIYPRENRDLALRIYETGCLFSEHPFPTQPTPANLVMRNRIISGLSFATIVVETSIDGGAMHAARYAQLQDRPVFACQWSPGKHKSDGTRQLIRKGSIPFSPNQLDDVIEMLTDPERLQTKTMGTSAKQMDLFANKETKMSSDSK